MQKRPWQLIAGFLIGAGAGFLLLRVVSDAPRPSSGEQKRSNPRVPGGSGLISSQHHTHAEARRALHSVLGVPEDADAATVLRALVEKAYMLDETTLRAFAALVAEELPPWSMGSLVAAERVNGSVPRAITHEIVSEWASVDPAAGMALLKGGKLSASVQSVFAAALGGELGKKATVTEVMQVVTDLPEAVREGFLSGAVTAKLRKSTPEEACSVVAEVARLSPSGSAPSGLWGLLLQEHPERFADLLKTPAPGNGAGQRLTSDVLMTLVGDPTKLRRLFGAGSHASETVDSLLALHRREVSHDGLRLLASAMIVSGEVSPALVSARLAERSAVSNGLGDDFARQFAIVGNDSQTLAGIAGIWAQFSEGLAAETPVLTAARRLLRERRQEDVVDALPTLRTALSEQERASLLGDWVKELLRTGGTERAGTYFAGVPLTDGERKWVQAAMADPPVPPAPQPDPFAAPPR